MKYIDSEKLIVEIERLKERAQAERVLHPKTILSAKNYLLIKDYDAILSTITSLQQEQPQVDLDFQVFAKEMDVVFNLPKEVTENTEENPLNWEYAIARHYFDLGQRTKYQQDREEFAKLKAKEWQSGYDEGFEKGLNARKEE